MKKFPKILMSFLLILMTAVAYPADGNQVTTFPPADVTLLESPFTQARATDLEYMFEMEPDRLLVPYLREAGLEPKAEIYGNWEGTGLGGHTAGHYISALSRMYAATGNQEVLDRLNYMVSELKRCQEANGNGYVGGVPESDRIWSEIAAGEINAEPFGLNGGWVPWYNIHKTYAGLRDAYLYARNEEALEVLVGMSDWALELTSDLSDAQIQEMLQAEHGGMNEVFADVAAITGEEKYLKIAQRFSHREILNPLIQQEDSLTGLHANTQIPKVIGFQRIAALTDNQGWHEASQFFWETVVKNRSVAIGGNSVREHFNPAGDFTPMIQDRQGPETCNTYNMLRLSEKLFEADGDPRYVEYYERALYNHILSSQNPDEGGFVYFTPMHPRYYRVYSQPDSSFWCCVGSGMENHSKYDEFIYAHDNDAVYVNLFIPSKVRWQEKGISITQATDFPDIEASTLSIEADSPVKFSLKVRYPSWVIEDKYEVKINGKQQKVTGSPGGFSTITREWQSGDTVELRMSMKTRLESLPDGSKYYAVLHGPFVLAAKTSRSYLEGLFADGGRWGHIPGDTLYPVEASPGFVGNPDEIADKIQPVEGKSLTFTASDVITPARYKDLELVPFYQVHEARYVLYWPHESVFKGKE
ncbi:MAG: glycoside hydrolase family 127 protein [Candidatus Marinimicrobia bacterium]|nr:glycoside hydrolase family 127 protein [Candidatus Neomarinimicrobiota bacterium]MCF7828213.1 glycoside hydrolase family 127 protein [Candidatus Neomarinimicrobiota bacterium]MCF7879612.1 glycoside hydrolase family 127 protein [Candidatus Neomarinimicrobiota bacterium]